MAFRRNWDKYEAVLLIDLFFRVKGLANDERAKQIENLSCSLRNYGISLGLPIDEKYRNIAGITIQYYQIENLYTKGKRGIKVTTPIFREWYEKRNDNSNLFDATLKRARELIPEEDSVLSNEASFFRKWLANQFPASNEKRYVDGLASFEKAYGQNRFFKATIYEICESRTIDEMIAEIKANTPWLESHKKKKDFFFDALAQYRAFLLSDYAPKKRAEAEKRTEKTAIKESDGASDKEGETTLEANIDETLRKSFPNGIRPDSFVDFQRFKNALQGAMLEIISDEMIKRTLQKIGFTFENRLYSLNLVSEEARNSIFLFLKQKFGMGVPRIHRDYIFDNFSKSLSFTPIFNSSFLLCFLKAWYSDEFSFSADYCSSSDSHLNKAGIQREIRQIALNYGDTFTLSQICKDLPYLSSRDIYYCLCTCRDFINLSKGSNTLYEYIECFDCGQNEVDLFRRIISSEIERTGYISGNTLFKIMRDSDPSFFERNPDLSPLGLRKVVQYYLSGSYFFSNNIISDKKRPLDLPTIYSLFAASKSTINFEELANIQSDLGSKICLKEIYDVKLRVNQKTFVDPTSFVCNVSEVDSAIEKLICQPYCSIKDFRFFNLLPPVGREWNEYLLESYLYLLSHSFILLHAEFNSTSVNGAIVLKKAGISDYNSLLAHVLADSNGKLEKAQALGYLQEHGYIERRRFDKIESVLREANLIRQSRQKKEG